MSESGLSLLKGESQRVTKTIITDTISIYNFPQLQMADGSARPARRQPTHTSTATRVRPSRTQIKTETHERQRISLTGSTAVVSDYFHYALNTILFQRSIYDQNDFKMVKKFGLQMMLVEDEAILEYLKKINEQVRGQSVSGSNRPTSRPLFMQKKNPCSADAGRW